MHIPSCLHLEEREIEAIQKWAEPFKWDADSYDATMTSNFVFEVSEDGLGYNVVVSCAHEGKHQECRVCIGDDNELYVTTKWWFLGTL